MNNFIILGGTLIGFIAGFYLGTRHGSKSMFHTWLFSVYIQRLFTGESPASCIKHSLSIVTEAIAMHKQHISQHGEKYQEVYKRRINQITMNRRNNF
jgi:hypothetical protein